MRSHSPQSGGRIDAKELAHRRTMEHVERAADAARARTHALGATASLTSCAGCGRIVPARDKCRRCGASLAGLPPLRAAFQPEFGQRRHRRGSAV